MARELLITNDLAESARTVFEATMLASVRERGRFVVCLAGGGTPLGAYRALAERRELPWDRTYVFWGDERFVPPTSPDSNARAARDALLRHVPVPADQVFAWPTPQEDDARAAADTAVGTVARHDAENRHDRPRDAARGGDGALLTEARVAAETYAATLQRVLGDRPTFDLQLLGLGADGHTASLFPGDTGALTTTGAGAGTSSDSSPGAVPTEVEPTASLTLATRPYGVEHVRLSLTANALSRSRTVVFLVSGEAKRAALVATLQGGDARSYPARAVTALERLVWITDLPFPPYGRSAYRSFGAS